MRFRLPASMRLQVALAAPRVDVPGRQVDSVDPVVRGERLPKARDAFSAIRSFDPKASALRPSVFEAPLRQRGLAYRRPQVPDLASRLFRFDSAVSLIRANLRSDSVVPQMPAGPATRLSVPLFRPAVVQPVVSLDLWQLADRLRTFPTDRQVAPLAGRFASIRQDLVRVY